jgi:hypothetical protein
MTAPPWAERVIGLIQRDTRIQRVVTLGANGSARAAVRVGDPVTPDATARCIRQPLSQEVPLA